MSDGDRTYLGDAVYARREGETIVLTVEYGNEQIAHEVYLEPEAMARLLAWMGRS